jgi:hypothetical protein
VVFERALEAAQRVAVLACADQHVHKAPVPARQHRLGCNQLHLSIT